MFDPWAVFDQASPRASQWIPDLNVRLICKECKEYPANLVENTSEGEVVCGSCGLVLQDHVVDTRAEWRNFGGDDETGPDPNRCGEAASTLLDGNQLDTSISFLPGATGRELARAHNRTNKDPTKTMLMAAYTDITTYCESMWLPGQVAMAAKEVFKEVHDSKCAKGREGSTIIASAIIFATRSCGLPRTFSEVRNEIKIPKKEFTRTFKIIQAYFHKKGGENQVARTNSGVVQQTLSQNANISGTGTVKGIIARLCNSLQLPHKCQWIAEELATQVVNYDTLGGRAPASTATSIIYMASHICQKPRTYKEISKISGVAVMTIKGAYRVLYAHRVKLVDPEWVEGGLSLLPSPESGRSSAQDTHEPRAPVSTVVAPRLAAGSPSQRPPMPWVDCIVENLPQQPQPAEQTPSAKLQGLDLLDGLSRPRKRPGASARVDPSPPVAPQAAQPLRQKLAHSAPTHKSQGPAKRQRTDAGPSSGRPSHLTPQWTRRPGDNSR